MAPRKSAPRPRGRPRKNPPSALPGIKHTPSRHAFSSDESDDSSMPPRSPVRASQQSLLGSHNTLKQLLSGGAGAEPEPVKTPPKSGFSRPIAASSESPIASASTPISRLKRATAQLNSPDNWAPSPVHFQDDVPPAKRRAARRGRPPKVKSETAGGSEAKSEARSEAASSGPRSAPRSGPRSGPKSGPRSGPRSEASGKPADKRKPDRSEPPSRNDNNGGPAQHVDLTADDSDFIPNKRRSSYNNRGKRQSSVGNGYSSKPHTEVSAHEYYKSLDPSMPEPNQMRQLLTWCFKKSLETADPDMSAAQDADTAKGIAKVIKAELLADLANGTISTSWYSAKNPSTELAGKRVVKPNPLNEANKESIEVFRRKLRSLELEKLQWREALESNLRKISGLAKNQSASNDGANNTDVDMPSLRKYLQARDGGDAMSQAVGTSGQDLANTMEQAAKESESMLRETLPSNMDQLFHISYQLKQSLGLVAQVEKELLSAQVSKLIKTFMNRNDQTEKWSHVSARNLMKGIARLDSSKRKALNEKYVG